MDGETFDWLARGMATSPLRRRRFVALAAPVLAGGAGLLALSGEDAAAGKKSCKKKKKKACIGKCGVVTFKCKKRKKSLDCGACPTNCDVCASGCQFSTVQAAINATTAGATISICAGTFTENIRIDRNLTLAGAGTTSTILDGGAAMSVIAINPELTAVAIRDLTITNGKSPGVGGGISNGNAQTTLTNVLITGNEATTRGGGFDVNTAGRVTLINSAVTNNTAGEFGGGAFNYGTIACTGSSFSGNVVAPATPSNCADFAPGTGCNTCS